MAKAGLRRHELNDAGRDRNENLRIGSSATLAGPPPQRPDGVDRHLRPQRACAGTSQPAGCGSAAQAVKARARASLVWTSTVGGSAKKLHEVGRRLVPVKDADALVGKVSFAQLRRIGPGQGRGSEGSSLPMTMRPPPLCAPDQISSCEDGPRPC